MSRFGIEIIHDGWVSLRDLQQDRSMGALTSADAIELRDLLAQHFPLEGWGSPGELAALAEYGAHRERRERIATAVLAGMLANPGSDGVQSPLMVHEPELATMVVRYADFLIAALDEGA